MNRSGCRPPHAVAALRGEASQDAYARSRTSTSRRVDPEGLDVRQAGPDVPPAGEGRR